MKDPALCMRNPPPLSQKRQTNVTLSLSRLTLSVSPEKGHQDDRKQEDKKQKEDEEEEEEVLDRQKCRAALASLRHTKWFQARVTDLKSGVIVLRIFRDMSNRLAGWQPLKGWPLELICEKAMATCNRPLGPGEGLRRVMECIASGILLPGQGSVLYCNLQAPSVVCIYTLHTITLV
ncbi:hypothetical protein NQZ68_008877 [Dissostichus eleginoides]|nr:hypothetical protein NQZ68_008877 [Dissostichus eleginoides]